jgi:hypothetical protein
MWRKAYGVSVRRFGRPMPDMMQRVFCRIEIDIVSKGPSALFAVRQMIINRGVKKSFVPEV